MRLISGIIDMISPRACELCGAKVKNSSICGGCRMTFARESFEHCPRCGRTALQCECSHSFTEITKTSVGGRKFCVLTFYKPENRFGKSERVTEKMIFGLKEHGRFAPFFAEELSRALSGIFDGAGENVSEWIITYPPRSTKKFYDCGFDQSELTANCLSRRLKCGVMRTMMRGGMSVEQKSLDYTHRTENAKSTLIPIKSKIKAGGRYILFDDIITSGATIESAASLLYSTGAAEVFPVAIALSYPGNKERE